ncbi:hypothetical protein MNBD_GAMMA21-35 [hydrothermal vent metagenome]|uniref:Uncharacterized protein n=1 Tax=hydrothermal vent metagenome TaxID=652676 RepID=A0A3B1AA37_9ZZZZ
MKTKIKIFLYVTTGLFLTVSGISEWANIGFMWGPNYSVEGEAGSMNIIISIIGIVFILAAYIEYDLHKPATNGNKENETDNHDVDL